MKVREISTGEFEYELFAIDPRISCQTCCVVNQKYLFLFESSCVVYIKNGETNIFKNSMVELLQIYIRRSTNLIVFAMKSKTFLFSTFSLRLNYILNSKRNSSTLDTYFLLHDTHGHPCSLDSLYVVTYHVFTNTATFMNN